MAHCELLTRLNRRFASALLILSVLTKISWAGDAVRSPKSVQFGLPTVVVLGPDQLTLDVLSGPGFFGTAMTKRNLPHFLSMTTAIQQAHPNTKGNILFVRFGTRASIFPYSDGIKNLSIKKIGDVPDIRDIVKRRKFRVGKVAQDLSADLKDHLSDLSNDKIGHLWQAHSASGKAFDNAVPGAPLTLAVPEVQDDAPKSAGTFAITREFERKMSLIYEELHHIASVISRTEPRGRRLPTFDLTHEPFLNFIESDPAKWKNHAQFFRGATRSVRKVLVSRARTRQELRLTEDSAFSVDELHNILILDEALTRFIKIYPLHARVAELRFFGGLSSREIGEALHLKETTARDKWAFAKAWLNREIERIEETNQPT